MISEKMEKNLFIFLLPLLVSSCIFLNQGGSGNVQEFPGIVAGQGGTTVLKNPVITPESKMELPAIEDDDIIITHKGYTISYNAKARIPEWVAYELTSEETTGDADREDAIFQMDPQYSRTQAMREDYSGSGWTKGHMACAGDFHWDEEAMDETFYLTNICPQDEELNKGDWNYLEKQIRYWARDNGKVWVVSGPIIGDNKYGTIGERDVVIPDSFFKAVLIQKKGKFHSIAFVMDNDDKRYFLSDCSMSVNELEELTGLDFFPELYDDVEESIESKINHSVWNIKDR